MQNLEPLDEDFLIKTSLTLADMSRLCGKPYNTVKRWHQRGVLPEPLAVSDGPQWSAHDAWSFALERGYRREPRPIMAWRHTHRNVLRAEARSYGIEVTYAGDEMGAYLRLIYPRHGLDSLQSARRSLDIRPGEQVFWIGPSVIRNQGWRLLHATLARPKISSLTTRDIAPLVGGTLPFWPEGLRSAVAPPQQWADIRHEVTVSWLEEAPHLAAEPLRSVIIYQRDVARAGAQQCARYDMEMAEEMGHFDIRVRPIQAPDPGDKPDVDTCDLLAQHESSPEVASAAASVVFRWAQDVHTIDLDHPLYKTMLAQARRIMPDQWSLAHHALASVASHGSQLRYDSVPQMDAFVVEGVEGLYLLHSETRLYFYAYHTILRRPDEFDAHDPNQLFARFGHQWLPIPQGHWGYYIGGDAGGSDVICDVMEKLLHGPYPVSRKDFSRHPWHQHTGQGGQLCRSGCPKRFGPGWVQDQLNTWDATAPPTS